MSELSILGTSGTYLDEPQIALRFLLASILGGIIGLEREIKQRPAGLRTNMLTSLAAAVFTVVTFEIYHRLGSKSGSDPIRVLEAVTAGVAFLAAGTIIQSRGNVEGLTTGAGMWMASAIGVACGAGYVRLAVIAVVLAMIILIAVRRFERHVMDTKGKSHREEDDDKSA